MIRALLQKLPVLVIAGLALGGLALGAVGSALLGNEPFIRVPEVHLAPQEVFTVGGFVVTNTLLSAWLTTVVVLLVFGLGSRKAELVPGRLQGAIEVLFEALYGFIKGVVGEPYARRFFPILATIFIFVSFNAWIALLPFYPTVGFKEEGAGYVTTHLLRSAGTDINMPLALAIISFVFVETWGFKAHRLGYLGEFFRGGRAIVIGVVRGRPGSVFGGVIDGFVGLLELMSHFIRLLSFTFRLFGNMIAGEIILVMITFLLIFMSPIAFYLLEILVGGVQGLIFMGLTLVFAFMAVSPHEADPKEANSP